jgi:hypothetical protein
LTSDSGKLTARPGAIYARMKPCSISASVTGLMSLCRRTAIYWPPFWHRN